MKVWRLLLVLLLVFSLYPTLLGSGQQVFEHISIGVIEGENLYNVTSIDLDKDTTYRIIFSNPTDVGHNLRIDVNGLQLQPGVLDTSSINDSADIVVGMSNNDPRGIQGSWNVTWTTPNYDTEIRFFCGYDGHYPDMQGKFVIGDISGTSSNYIEPSNTTDNSSTTSELPISLYMVFLSLLPVVTRRYRV